MIQQYFQTGCPARFLLALACTATLFGSCQSRVGGSPEGYDLNKPQEMQLGKVLNEISGISYKAVNHTLVAISDSKEQIFGINLKNKKLKDLTKKVVPKDSDLEDVVATDSAYYLLSSKGTIIEVPLAATDSSGLLTYSLELSGHNDFETMYYDPTARGLVLICKTCAHEKGQGTRSAYRFDLETKQFDSTIFFTINRGAVEDLLKDKDAKVEPSAAAIHPVNKRLYILSSAGNMLIVTDTRGKVIEAYSLNPDRFPQAEGIAFAQNGDMYITNEGKFGKPTLLFFPYRSGKKNK